MEFMNNSEWTHANVVEIFNQPELHQIELFFGTTYLDKQKVGLRGTQEELLALQSHIEVAIQNFNNQDGVSFYARKL
jgi:hypothetical protein